MIRVEALRNQRALIQASYDCFCWSVALWAATLLRYDLDWTRISPRGVAGAALIVTVLQVVAAIPFGIYRGRWRVGSFDEVAALFQSCVLASCLLTVVNLGFDPLLVPRSAPLGAGLVAVVLMAGGRYLWRLGHERRRRPNGSGCQRLLVFGAGEGAVEVVRAMLSDRDSGYIPVALLDDSPAKRNLRIMGVPVVGSRAALAEAAERFAADALLIAIPSAQAALITEISELGLACDLQVKVLPTVSQLLGDQVGVGDIRDITPADLLGRHEIRTDIDSITGYLTGKRVLVTGAGGSIGSELCRQIHRLAPAELIMVDRDESGLHGVELSITGRALLDSPDLVLLDLRDSCSVERLVAQRRPQVIFHAAALKHLPLLERHPAEAVKTNVWATLTLLEAAVANGVERFVNISSDKAADPQSVLGYTKRISERLTAYMAGEGPTVCLSVRFGNVLMSRGSVLTTFQSQIERGGPLTVTHPDVTRYFMTTEEAVELVIQAGAIGGPGEVLVLDIGEPVRVADVARVLAARSRRPIPIKFTGLRPGEKLHESLFGCDEEDRRQVHPLISHVEIPPLPSTVAREIDVSADDVRLIAQLDQLCCLATAYAGE